jgi:hypothetical protein
MGDASVVACLLSVALFMPAPVLSAPAPSVTLSGMVGAKRLSFRVTRVAGEASFAAAPRAAAYVAVTEVHAGTMTPTPVRYLVTGDGLTPYERAYTARGFGPVTYALPVAGGRAGAVRIRNLAGAAAAPCILRVRGVTRAEIDAARAADRFALCGTVINPLLGMPEEEQAQRLAASLPPMPGRAAGPGFSYEIYYAAWGPEAVRAQLVKARDWSRRHRMKALLGLVSWWNGTPRRVPDGLGGAFDDLKYQQVCYTPGAEHAENPELRALLGARYSRHYRLSVPNIWSNTPWLTMNSATLNAYRARRMAEAVQALKEVSAGDTSWVAGLFLENEPRYWDTQSTQGTPQWAGEQWADFNPMTVADAAKEGVTLDPADGMSQAELVWLQRNVGRYFQQTADAANRALRAGGMAGRVPVYTHSLQLSVLFPCQALNQSPADWARASGARTGIEGIWSNLSDFDRVREWGPWCNLNREETDGLPLETHLWDLRATYAAGGEFYNSYNWHTLKGDGYPGYARAFAAALPTAQASPLEAARASDAELTLKPPQALQAFGEIEVAVEPSGAVAAVALEMVSNAGTTFSARRSAAKPGATRFMFPVPAEVHWSATARLLLHAYDAKGRELPNAARFAHGAEKAIRLHLDLGECRALSLVTIRRAGRSRRAEAGAAAPGV